MSVAKNERYVSFFNKIISSFNEKIKNRKLQRRTSIRTTTAAIIAVTLAGLILLLYVFSSVSLTSGFSSLENKLTEDNVQRAMNAVNTEVDRLDAIANAWASSEELPDFTKTGDTSQARLIFSDGRLVDVGVNILLITDSKGNILWHKYLNLDYNHQMPTPKSLLSQITEHDCLLGTEEKKGAILLNSGVMLIASRSFNSAETGEFSGNLLVGRYFDRKEIESLSKTTQLNLQIFENRTGFESYFEAFNENNEDFSDNKGAVLVKAVNEEYVSGFSIIYDIYGNPAAVLQTTSSRDVTLYGRGVFNFQIFMLAFAALIFGVVILILIQRSIISRLEILNMQIEDVARTENPENRISVSGNDEISSLGTAINKMLESIKKSEENYIRLFDNANDLIFTLSPDGNFTSANRETEKMTGFKNLEIIGKNIRDVVKKDDLRRIDNIFSGAYDNNSNKTEIRLTNSEKKESIIEFSTQQVTDSSGEEGFFVIARDVTLNRKAEEEIKIHRNHLKELVEERTKQLEKANSDLTKEVEERARFEESLAAEKERLSVTLSSIAEGVVATDKSGNITLINKEAASKTGYESGYATGKRIDSIIHLEKDRKTEDICSILRAVIHEKKIHEINTEIHLFSTKGVQHPVVLSAAPLLDRTGAAIGAVIIFRDISERLGWEEEVLRRQKVESLGVLAGGIAHDFNNILTAISGNIALAKNSSGENTDLSLRLEEAEKAVSRAKGITRQLITFSKGGAPVKQISDIKELIRESSEFVAHGSNIRLNFDIADDLSNVEADRGQLSQVIENLVINAIQSMPAGGNIYIKAKNAGRISGKDGLEDGNFIVIRIKDEGTGIPEEYKKRIFDPYFTTKKDGNGLGLASCISIIRKHGGAIKVASEVNKGTEFSIYLPATEKIPDADPFTAGENLSGTSRVLVMDDDKNIFEIIPVLLMKAGFEVLVAKDGAEAIRLYQESCILNKPIDIFVMDLTIPGGLGGVDTIGLLREFDADLLAIVSSGYSNDPVMANFKEYGFNAVLPKPYQIQELIALINRLVSEKKSREN